MCGYCGSRYLTRQPLPRPAPLPLPHPAPRPVQKVGAGGVVLAALGVLTLLGAVAGGFAVWRNPAPRSAAPLRPTSSPTLELLPTATAEPEPPASASFNADSRISGYQSSFYVLGFLKNTSPFTIDKPKVTAVLLDKAGKELGSRDGYAEADAVPPGGVVPVKVLISDPPAHDRVSFEVVVKKASYVAEQVDGLRLEVSGAPHQTFGNSWEVTGKVFNDGPRAARFVKILVLAFDAKSKLIGLDATYADGESLAAGGSARFRAMPLYDAAPHHFQFSVSGRPAK